MPMLPELGRLEPVDLRTCWENEATGFTPWLAADANLNLLGEVVGMDLELAGREQWVGPFRADILCKNTAMGDEGEWVLIENQLERTDHVHLGQLLTYAAGLHTCSIIWIARQFTEEHRAALDWLNEHTTQEIKFFGLEIQLWRIGDSAFAPKFNVVCRPNDYSRTVIACRDAGDQQVSFRYAYWTALLAKLAEEPGTLKLIKPSDANWISFSIGRTGFTVNLVINSRDQWVRVELYLSGSLANNRFQQLQLKQGSIEDKVGKLEWEGLVGKRDCRVAIYKRLCDPRNELEWTVQHNWLIEKAKSLHIAFAPVIRELDDKDILPSEEMSDVGQGDPKQLLYVEP